MKIGIVNYGLGNIKSIMNAFIYANKQIEIKLINYPEELSANDKIILPGVGAFGDAMKLIRKKNFDEAIFEEINKGKYLLGICLGMQLLASKSYEFGEFNGLNLIEGEVIKFKPSNEYRVPHIGWNNLAWEKNYELFNEIDINSDFYFVHSYYFKTKEAKHTIGVTNYIDSFSSVIKKENIIGTQFHPEKSQKDGIQLIKNFINL